MIIRGRVNRKYPYKKTIEKVFVKKLDKRASDLLTLH